MADNQPHLTTLQERLVLFTLLAINVTHIVDFMIMMPLGPQLKELFLITNAQFGLLVSAYAVAAGLSGVLATTYIDRLERKSLLLGLYAGFAIATFCCAIAPDYWTLMAARVAAGLFGGVLGALAQTIVADIIPFERRGKAMGVVMSSFALSTVAGVPFSLWLAQKYQWHAPFFALSAASVLVMLIAWFSIPRIDKHLAENAGRRALANLIEVLSLPAHWRGWGLSFLIIVGSFAIIPYLTIYTTSNTGLLLEDVPLIYLTGGVVTLISTRVWGILTDKLGAVTCFRMIALLSLIPILILTNLSVVPLWVLLIVTSLFFIFVPGRMVPAMTLVSAAAEPRLRGSFMTLNSATISAALGIGSVIGGLLITGGGKNEPMVGYDHVGWLSIPMTAFAIWFVGKVKIVGRH